MKKILIGIILLASTICFADSNVCENQSYQVTIQDYTGDCKTLILNSAKQNNCSNYKLYELNNGFSSGSFSYYKKGASTFCKLITLNGYYQVMTDDMSEPPVAAVFYSKND